jgi:Holliday junction resolvasome RuvABC endonuclease subunit
MITLGLDPGLQTTNPAGWAVVDFDRPLEQAILAAGILPPRRGLRWEDQIAEQVAAIPALCSEYLVSYIACEDAFYGTNAQTFRQLVAWAWEARVMARRAGCPFVLVSPADQAKVRKTIPDAVTGPAVAYLPERFRPHALSAIAIAWHGAGLLARTRYAAA